MIYLADADSSMPNLALMRLGTFFEQQGETVRLVRPADTFLPLFDKRGPCYGSSLFSFEKSAKARAKIEREWGPVIWGGTGVDVASSLDRIAAGVDWERMALLYRLYPHVSYSIGFLTRGCRLHCPFCVVPGKEGKPRAVRCVHDIWRGDPYPRHLHLLDNDAFAPSLRDHWQQAVREIREGNFRVCFSQGINIRLIDDEGAAAIGTIHYTGHDFEKRRLYTAWDSLGDERVFRRGVATLDRHGVPAHHLRVYMLVGYDKRETWETIFYRFTELRALGCDPFPMVYNKPARPDLAAFQRWAVGFTHGKIPWPEYKPSGDRRPPSLSPADLAASDAAWNRVVGGWRPARALEVQT